MSTLDRHFLPPSDRVVTSTNFTDASLNGDYRVYGRSSVPMPAWLSPSGVQEGESFEGIVHFDGQGNFSGAINLGGEFEGTYRINPDGTGTAEAVEKFRKRQRLPVHSQFRIYNSGNVEYVAEDDLPGWGSSGTLHKQDRQNRAD